MDRNGLGICHYRDDVSSLSARRAWIEMHAPPKEHKANTVALRKESVDRNYKERPGQKARPKSLSARRAWIEICCSCSPCRLLAVALRKESVDRNFYYADKDADWVRSLSARRAWIEISCLLT